MRAQAAVDQIRHKIERIRYGEFTDIAQIRAIWD